MTLVTTAWRFAYLWGTVGRVVIVLLTRNRALDNGRVVKSSCRWAMRSRREP